MRTHIVLASAAVLAVLVGCEDVPATNPFDPATPVSQQAQARLEGTVTLPEGFGETNLADGRVDLVDAAGEVALTSGVADGTYLFDAVNAGAYLVRVIVPGLRVAERPVQLLRGETLRQPPIALSAPSTEDIDALFVVGVARLEGAPEAGHQGIFVEVQDTPYNALTARDGTFRVQAPPGESASQGTGSRRSASSSGRTRPSSRCPSPSSSSASPAASSDASACSPASRIRPSSWPPTSRSSPPRARAKPSSAPTPAPTAPSSSPTSRRAPTRCASPRGASSTRCAGPTSRRAAPTIWR